MSDRIRCACQRCTIRSLMGPAIIITVGVLFLLDQIRGGNLSFENTWPVILIVIGAISLSAAASSTEGHVSRTAPPGVVGAPGPTPTAPQKDSPGQGPGQ